MVKPVRRVLLTGAGKGGIGGATALRFAADARKSGQQLRIALSATGKRSGLADLVGELKDHGADVAVSYGEFRDSDAPQRVVEEAIAHCGGLDVVMANAGVGRNFPLKDMQLKGRGAARTPCPGGQQTALHGR